MHKAKVLVKDVWGGENRGAFAGNRFYIPVAPTCRVTFELENRESITLIVPNKIYNRLNAGSTGTLKYIAGNERFKKFTVSEI